MKKLIIITSCLLLAFTISAQVDFQISKFNISIAGTSTMHDWTADVKTVTGTADMELNNGELKGMNSLVVHLDANSIKSEKGSMMDKNIYKALKTNKYDEITFRMTRVNSLVSDGHQATVKVSGNLTIAGTTKPVVLTATGAYMNGSYKFTGSKKIKMTDFNVEPPEFMLGAMKTGDEVTISYEVTVANSGLSQKK